MKNIVIVNSTPRTGGNSEILAQEFARGATEAGHCVKQITVRSLGLKFCTGCLFCQSHGKCVLNDGMNALYESVQQADVLVFATPVYFYSVCGQLKTFLDRLNPLYPRKNRFNEVYLLATAAEREESAIDCCVSDIQGWIDCFDGVVLKDVLRGVGAHGKGEILKTEFPARAYEMGKNV